MEAARTVALLATMIAWPVTVWVSFASMMAAVDYTVACKPNAAFSSLQLLIAPIILATVGAWGGRAAKRQLIWVTQIVAIVAIGVAAASAGLLFALAVAAGITYDRYTSVLSFAPPLAFAVISLLLAIFPVAARRLTSPVYYSTFSVIAVVLIVAILMLRVIDAASRCH